MDHLDTGSFSIRYDFPEIWHDTPSQYIECTCKLNCNINFDPLASIKRLFSVPRCCVLPEDMVSGLAMHGKPIALSINIMTNNIMIFNQLFNNATIYPTCCDHALVI
mgnify:CR=1 FL=1